MTINKYKVMIKVELPNQKTDNTYWHLLEPEFDSSAEAEEYIETYFGIKDDKYFTKAIVQVVSVFEPISGN